MTCDAFARWLDDGEAPSGAAAAHAHGATCARCAEALADLHAFEAWVSAPVSAPSDLTDHVMRRVASAERARAAVADAPIGDSMPWWVRVASQPSVVLAAALAALIVGFAPAIASGASSLAVRLADAWRHVETPALASGRSTFDLFADPWVQIGLAWGALPAIALASLGLQGWAERLLTANWAPRTRPARPLNPTIY
jgi:hypothetical protein